MIKKSIKAKNILNNEVETRDLYFNLTKAEALEINLMEDLESVGKSDNPRAIIPVFKRIMKYAYGVKLTNGKFTKDEEQTSDFLASDFYSELLLELLQLGEKGVADFIKSILDFSVEELQDADKAAQPTRPAPQDYKKSAREIAAEAAAEKEADVVKNVDPAEAKRVPNYAANDTSTRFEDSPEYQAFLQRQQGDLGATNPADDTVNLGNQPIVPTNPVEPISNEDRTAAPAHQQLRRDNH